MKKYYNIRDSYKEYKKEHVPIDIKTYLDIAYSFMKFIMFKVLEGHMVVLPERLGTINVQGRKQNIRINSDTNQIIGLAPNWQATRDLWNRNAEAKKEKKMIYHTNDHTQGVRYKYRWSKKKILVENKMAYSLKFTRTMKRALAKRIKEGKEYIIV